MMLNISLWITQYQMFIIIIYVVISFNKCMKAPWTDICQCSWMKFLFPTIAKGDAYVDGRKFIREQTDSKYSYVGCEIFEYFPFKHIHYNRDIHNIIVLYCMLLWACTISIELYMLSPENICKKIIVITSWIRKCVILGWTWNCVYLNV